jgi:hypothetical protein
MKKMQLQMTSGFLQLESTIDRYSDEREMPALEHSTLVCERDSHREFAESRTKSG